MGLLAVFCLHGRRLRLLTLQSRRATTQNTSMGVDSLEFLRGVESGLTIEELPSGYVCRNAELVLER